MHNHPSLTPGGGPDAYALDLFEAMRRSGECEPLLVARSDTERPRPGVTFSSLDRDPSQYLARIEEEGFDLFYLTYSEKSLYTRYFTDFLRAHEPDVVHFHHSLYTGCELVSLVRNLLPRAAIVYTLHDYMPICHRAGRFVRTIDESLCLEPSPHRCHECFPERSEQDFFLRRRFIRAHLDHVDRFVAPSRFVLERYAEWGIPRARILLEEYGRPPAQPIPDDAAERQRDRLGFFADMSEFDFEGAATLLQAMRLVRERTPEAHLWLHGSNLERYHEPRREEFDTLLHEAGNVTLAGDYDRRTLPEAISAVDWVVVPSRWWESSPLVIQDAFLYRRPVICSDIGAMAEKVAHGVSGLHFTVSDPHHLAATIERAVTDAGLWERLRAGIPPVHRMDDHMATLTALYRDLLEGARRVRASAMAP